MSDPRETETSTAEVTFTPSATGIEEIAEQFRDMGMSELVKQLRTTSVPIEQWDYLVGVVWETGYIDALKTHLESLMPEGDPTEMDWKFRTRCRVGPISVDNTESGPFFAGHTYHCQGKSKPSSLKNARLRTRIFQLGFARYDTDFHFTNVLVDDSEKTVHVQRAAELGDRPTHGQGPDS